MVEAGVQIATAVHVHEAGAKHGPCSQRHRCWSRTCVSLVLDKPQESTLRYSWFTAAWIPSFTEFLHQYLANQPIVPPQEVLINDVIQAAIDSGLKVEVEIFENGSFLDIGTPEDLIRAVRQGASQA